MSIKGIERARRASSNTHFIKGTLTKVSRDWRTFLLNDKYKRCFTSMPLDFLAYFFQVLMVCKPCQRKFKNLIQPKKKQTQRSSFTVDILLGTHQMRVQIIIRSPVTDIFILLLNFSLEVTHKVLFDTGAVIRDV